MEEAEEEKEQSTMGMGEGISVEDENESSIVDVVTACQSSGEEEKTENRNLKDGVEIVAEEEVKDSGRSCNKEKINAMNSASVNVNTGK